MRTVINTFFFMASDRANAPSNSSPLQIDEVVYRQYKLENVFIFCDILKSSHV